MKEYIIAISDRDKVIHKENLKLGGSSPVGERTYYMKWNGRPFFGICR